MAIKYTSQSGEIFEIGLGFEDQGLSAGLSSPFPKYSISREAITSPDGTLLNNKYTISISGKIIASELLDVTNLGEKQNDLQKQAIWLLKLKRASYSQDHNIGRLEIESYGGLANKFIFEDARLTSVNIPEQEEGGASVLFSNYSLSFEAYKDSSIDNSGSSVCNKIISFEESWEITENESAGSYLSISANSEPYKSYTISHSISATGIKSLENSATEVRLAWKNAEDFVKSKLVSSPANIISSDISGNANRISKTFDPRILGYQGEDNSITGPDLSQNSYSFYAHTRSPRCDMAGGSYSVTESWIASNMPSPATIDMSIENSIDESGLITVNLSGTINGLMPVGTVNSNSVGQKLTNAESVLSLIDSSAYLIAKNSYDKEPSQLRSSFTLQDVIRSKTISRNKNTGVITFSYSYNDNTIPVQDSISSSISINYDNEERDIAIVAIIPIIAKKDKPITQDMDTTKERRRSITIDAVMKKSNRLSKPNIRSLLDTYKPSYPHKVQTFQESWQPINGTYSLNVEWLEVD